MRGSTCVAVASVEQHRSLMAAGTSLATSIALSDSDDEAASLGQRLGVTKALSPRPVNQPAGRIARKAPAAAKRKAAAAESSDDDDDDVSFERAPRQRRAAAPKPKPKRKAKRVASSDDDSDDASPSESEHVPAKQRKLAAPKPAAAASSSSSPPRDPPTSEAEAAYLAARRACVKARRFNLAEITPQVVSTSRTIKPMAQWKGLWPALREFMQNTIDHLQLLGADGTLHRALTMQASSSAITFRCGDEAVCAILIAADRLTIEQAYTYPLHPRALDTGVSDRTKGGEHTAGGFGDGFKTAAIALLAQKGLGARVRWRFEPADGAAPPIEWAFVGAERAAVGTFRASEVLEVQITRPAAASSASSDYSTSGGPRMLQWIDAKGIGDAFRRTCMPRLQLFWPPLLGAIGGGKRLPGSLLAHAADQHAVPAALSAAPPEPGVYVKGIWVQKPLIDGALIAFCGKANVDVSGRDRNTVDDEEAAAAVMRILKATEQKELLAQLSRRSAAPSPPPPRTTTTTTPTMPTLRARGRERTRRLLPLRGGRVPRHGRRPRAAAVVAAADAALHQPAARIGEGVLPARARRPEGAVFVSSRTTASKDAFVKWAAHDLETPASPQHPLGVGASTSLCAEVSPEELEGLCVRSLLAEQKSKQLPPEVAARTAGVKKLLKALPSVRDRLNVTFHPSVGVTFVHGRHCFVPAAQPLSRHAILRLLNVVQKELGSYSDEFTHLQQAIFETVVTVASDVDVPAAQLDAALERAKSVKKEAAAFARGAAERPVAAAAPPPADGSSKSKEVVSLDDDADDDDAGPSDAGLPRRRRQPRRPWRRRRPSHSTTKLSLGQLGGGRSILPPAAFADDASGGREDCIHPRAALKTAAAPAEAGGGAALRRGDGGGDRRLGSGAAGEGGSPQGVARRAGGGEGDGGGGGAAVAARGRYGGEGRLRRQPPRLPRVLHGEGGRDQPGAADGARGAAAAAAEDCRRADVHGDARACASAREGRGARAGVARHARAARARGVRQGGRPAGVRGVRGGVSTGDVMRDVSVST